jgi:hypothetical protein
LSLKTEAELKALLVEAVEEGDWLGFCAVIDHGRTPLTFGFLDDVAKCPVFGDRYFLSALLDYSLTGGRKWVTKGGGFDRCGLCLPSEAECTRIGTPYLEQHRDGRLGNPSH